MQRKGGHDQKDQEEIKAHAGVQNSYFGYFSTYSRGSKMQSLGAPTTPSSGLRRSTEGWGPENCAPAPIPVHSTPSAAVLPPWWVHLPCRTWGPELLRLTLTSRLPLLCRTITVTLGAHNIQRQERTQQRTGTLRAIRHPNYDPQTNRNDIMLLQVPPTPPSGSPAQPVGTQCWELRHPGILGRKQGPSPRMGIDCGPRSTNSP